LGTQPRVAPAPSRRPAFALLRRLASPARLACGSAHPNRGPCARLAALPQVPGEPEDPLRKAADWLPFLETTFPVSDGLLSRIAPAGILRSVGKGLAALPDSTAAILRRLDSGEHVPGYTALYFEAVAPIQQSVAFLTGGWFEIVVAKAMQHSGRFRDIRWSAQIEQQGGAQIEEDLLALDGLEAVCVSCKSSSERARILPHLEEFQSRAHSIGGRMTRRFLAIHTLRDPQGHVASRAKALGINLLTPGDLSKPAPFA
jgi:hypothetical protein